MQRASIGWIRALAAVAFTYSLFAAVRRPLGTDEARLWADLVQPPFREALHAPDAWSGLAYAVLAKRAVGLFRLSELALRVPALLAGAICLRSLWKRTTYWTGAAYLTAAALGWFWVADGRGIALALLLAGPIQSGWRLGVAIAFSPMFALLLPIFWRIKEIEKVVIPAVVALFLILFFPAIHAGAVDTADQRDAFHREANRRNAARGGGFQPPTVSPK